MKARMTKAHPEYKPFRSFDFKARKISGRQVMGSVRGVARRDMYQQDAANRWGSFRLLVKRA